MPHKTRRTGEDANRMHVVNHLRDRHTARAAALSLFLAGLLAGSCQPSPAEDTGCELVEVPLDDAELGLALGRRYISDRPARSYTPKRAGRAGRYSEFAEEMLHKVDAEIDLGRFDSDGAAPPVIAPARPPPQLEFTA